MKQNHIREKLIYGRYLIRLIFYCGLILSGVGVLGVAETPSSTVIILSSPTALVPGHTGADYNFTGNYANGSICINQTGGYYLTSDLNTSFSDYAIQINASGVSLDGNGRKITGSSKRGIKVTSSGVQSIITNFTNITGFESGIYSLADYVQVSNTTVSGNRRYGVFSLGNNSLISHNTLFNNNEGVVCSILNFIYPFGGEYATITDNVIYGNRLGMRTSGNHALVERNIVAQNVRGGIETSGLFNGGEDSGTDGTGHYTDIKENIVYENGDAGISVLSPSIKVQNNIIYQNDQIGILVFYSKNCSVMNNTIRDNRIGIISYLWDSGSLAQERTFTNNTILNNSETGIRFPNMGEWNVNFGKFSIYDNFFANQVNVETDINITNISWIHPNGPVLRPNIMNGSYIAGNYWSSPSGYGWSDLQDPTKSGYSTIPYEVVNGANSWDTAPLVRSAEYINASHDPWTTMIPTGNFTVVKGSDKAFLAQAKPGAELIDMIIDDQSIGPAENYTFTRITSDHSIVSTGIPIPGQVHVFFAPNISYGEAPLTVSFTNQSLGNPTSFWWNFGDGESSAEQNPVHTYDTPGVYSVSLKAMNDQTGGVATLTNAITVTNGPVPSPTLTPVPGEISADFTASLTTGPAPISIQFTDNSTGNPTAWFWDLGDGSSSTQQNVTHTYLTKGTYSVSLSAQNVISSGKVEKSEYIIVS